MRGNEYRKKVASMYPNSNLWRDKVMNIMPIKQVIAIYDTSYEKRMNDLAKSDDQLSVFEVFHEALTSDMRDAWDDKVTTETSKVRRRLMDICTRFDDQVTNYMEYPEKYVKPDWSFVEELFKGS